MITEKKELMYPNTLAPTPELSQEKNCSRILRTFCIFICVLNNSGNCSVSSGY